MQQQQWCISFRRTLRAELENQPHSDIHWHWSCHTVSINTHHHQHDHGGGRGEPQWALGERNDYHARSPESRSYQSQQSRSQTPKHSYVEWGRLRMCCCAKESCHFTFLLLRRIPDVLLCSPTPQGWICFRLDFDTTARRLC